MLFFLVIFVCMKNPVLSFFWFVYLVVIYLPFGVSATILCAIVTGLGCSIGDHRKWGYYPGMIWSRFMMALALCPFEVEGAEKLDPTQSYVFASNHTSMYDVFAIYGWIGRPFKWILKEELRKLPFVGKACELAGFIYIKRGGGKKMLESVKRAEAILQEGVSVVIFPEGSRTCDGETGAFKRGGFEIAREMHLPIVPISLSGGYFVCPKNRYYPVPHRMKMVIGDPVAFEPADVADEKQLIGQIRQTVIAGIDPQINRP